MASILVLFPRRCIVVRPRGAHGRLLTTFVDPFGAKDPQRATVDVDDVQERNQLVGYSKMIGDPKKGLADDTSVHPFGDLRINFARLNPHNLCFWWEYDFTGGKILNNGQNALLSNETKNKMYAQHKSRPNEWTVERLAEAYRIRLQRVMAILSLKKLAEQEMGTLERNRTKHTGIPLIFLPLGEDSAFTDAVPPEIHVAPAAEEDAEENPGEEDAGNDPEAQEAEQETSSEKKNSKPSVSDEEWYQLCDWAEVHVFGATAREGSGERHFVSVPTYPQFEEIPLSEAHKYANTEWSISRVNRLYTAKEDKFQIREFKERLSLNTGEAGTTLDFKTDRRQMHRSPPKDITPLIVTSLDAEMRRPYVAEADGTQRKLTEDEFLLWKRNNREAFTKLVEQQIQREGKRKQESSKH